MLLGAGSEAVVGALLGRGGEMARDDKAGWFFAGLAWGAAMGWGVALLLLRVCR